MTQLSTMILTMTLLLRNCHKATKSYPFLGTRNATGDRSQRFPQVSCGHVAGVFRFRWFGTEVFRIERNRCRADRSPLVVGFSFHSRGFRKFVRTLAEELTEEFILSGVLIIGRTLAFLLLPAFFRRFSFRRRLILIRLLLFSRYQRLVFENRVESRDDEFGTVNLLLDDFRFTKLLFGFFAQEKSELFIPLRPGLVSRGGLELFLARN